MRVFVGMFGVFLFLLVFVFAYLYFDLGLDSYLQAVYSIENLPAEQKQSSKNYFYFKNATTYRGTIAKIDAIGVYGSVWVWTVGGLKHFYADENTIFSFYNTCAEPLRSDLKNGNRALTEDRSIYTDINAWTKMVMPGYFVEIQTPSNGNADTIREIYAYDSWWPFEPIILEDLCGN